MQRQRLPESQKRISCSDGLGFFSSSAFEAMMKPGVLVASKALLERNPDPTETEVRYWLAGNLCRCTGYDKIVTAVKDAAVALRK